MTELKPLQFGKYTLLDRIATGGMAELYRAKITGVQGFEKLVAIKKILPHLTDEESLITSFIEEAKLAAFLQHPNIVQIYDFGSVGGRYFLAMEYLFGQDLKYITKKSEQTGKWFSLEDSLYISAQICRGLNYAHNLKDFHGNPLNIIHRDIGPQNVFVTYDGQVKLIDFGIAKAANRNTRTQPDLIKGKIAYMSPEQAQGKEIDHRSDIFSMGILLYEMVTRKRMFVGDTYRIYPRVCNAEFEPPETAEKGLPPLLYEILNRALAKGRSQRYQSADEMASDLELCISRFSHRPGPRTISKYVKTVLKKEAATEQRAMWKATTSSNDIKSPGTLTETGSQGEKTLAFDARDLTEKSKGKRTLSSILALILILGGVLYGIGIAENPIEIFNKGKKIILVRLFGQNGVEKIKLTTPMREAHSEILDSPKNPLSCKKTPIRAIPDPPELAKSKKLVSEKRFAEAIVFLKKLLAKEPSFQASAAEPYSKALEGVAVKLAANEPEKAKKLLFKSVEMNPENSSAYYLLGRLYTKEKNYQKAVSSYKKAIALDTNIPAVYFNLGYIFYAINKDYSRAQEMYERTVALSPPFLDEAFFNLALVQKRLGKKQESINNLERAIRFNSNNMQARKLLKRLTRNENKTG